MELLGTSIIGKGRGASEGETLRAINPASGELLEPLYYSASESELNRATDLASEAAYALRRTSGRERARLLREIAANLEKSGAAIIERMPKETGLPPARIQSELGRTTGQLRMFAELLEEGSWVDARIDRPDPERKPVPKPDVRSMMLPLGPVAVFCAGNFPLAFSVAGGDTASALAGGNPVIVHAHYGHPGTAELAGMAIQKAVATCGMHEGCFSLIYGAGYANGIALVKHPAIHAVGFTGSRSGGHALMVAAASRSVPIPVFAEMSSTNPVFILPGALQERWKEIAAGLFASVTLGAGQFCTNPGLVFVPELEQRRYLTDELTRLAAGPGAYTLLTGKIHEQYVSKVAERKAAAGMRLLAESAPGQGACGATAVIFETDGAVYLRQSALQEEIFGPSTLLVHATAGEMLESARNLDGHLTATIHGTEEDLREHAELIALLETRAGRIVYNGYPTGVEVGHAMVHGGPYPATSDSRSTSVGTRAIYRFTRPVCYQNLPDVYLPDELKNSNPLGIDRMVDGQRTKGAVI